MMRFLGKHRYKIFLFTMVVFVGGTFVGFGAYFFSGKHTPGDTLLDVNGEKIPARLFFSHYRQMQDQSKAPLDDATRQQKRDDVIRDLVQNEVFSQEAQRYGILVPDAQVAMSLAQVPAFQERGAFSPRIYIQALQSQIRLSPQDFEEEQRRNLAFFKLRWLIQSCIKVTDDEVASLYAFQHQSDPKANFKKDKDAFTNQVWQQKVLWAFNEWFKQIGQRTKVTPHLDVLEGEK